MTKSEIYEAVLADIAGHIAGQREEVSVLANAAAFLAAAFPDRFLWTGFYVVRGERLVLGPFQGPPACYAIRRGRGVCGTAWATGRAQVVPDVGQVPGHIACSSLSRSEVVVPVWRRGADRTDPDAGVVAVLDVDSRHLAAFDDADRLYLERLADLLTEAIY